MAGNTLIRATIIILTCFALFACESLSSTNEMYPVFGMVYDSLGNPVNNARFQLSSALEEGADRTDDSISAAYEAQSSINGRFTLQNVPSGEYLFRVTAENHLPVGGSVRIAHNSDILHIVMESRDSLLIQLESHMTNKQWEAAHSLLLQLADMDPTDPLPDYLFALWVYNLPEQQYARFQNYYSDGLVGHAVSLLQELVANGYDYPEVLQLISNLQIESIN